MSACHRAQHYLAEVEPVDLVRLKETLDEAERSGVPHANTGRRPRVGREL